MRRRTTAVLMVFLLSMGLAAPVTAQEGSIGIVDTSTGEWFLRDPVNGATTRFLYGNPGDVPMVGDWDCDGDETPGLYRQSDGFAYLRNSNSQGVADIRFFFGNPGDIPLAGDFDGDGCDTVSIYRASEARIYIVNALGANEGGLGPAEFSFLFGNPGDKPFVGDFDGDGIDEVGLHRESTGLVYFRLTHTQGPADHSFIFGDPADKIVAAEWGGRGSPGPETVGLFRPSTCETFLRYSNSQGLADETLLYGLTNGLPVAGAFGVLPGGASPPSRCAVSPVEPGIPPPPQIVGVAEAEVACPPYGLPDIVCYSLLVRFDIQTPNYPFAFGVISFAEAPEFLSGGWLYRFGQEGYPLSNRIDWAIPQGIQTIAPSLGGRPGDGTSPATTSTNRRLCLYTQVRIWVALSESEPIGPGTGDSAISPTPFCFTIRPDGSVVYD